MLFVLFLYGVLFLIVPEKTLAALGETTKTAATVLGPLLVVFVLMVLMNLFIHPGRIVRFVGEKSGFRGLMFAALAGILSMGPIYAWYPFLRDIRAKGAGTGPIAVFLGNRAVKPVLLPVLISYFGWRYTLLLTALTFLGALGLGRLMGLFVKE